MFILNKYQLKYKKECEQFLNSCEQFCLNCILVISQNVISTKKRWNYNKTQVYLCNDCIICTAFWRQGRPL